MQIHVEKQEWRYKGNNFSVEVVRWNDPSYLLAKDSLPDNLKDVIPENNWNVYVYVYQKHPLFDKITHERLYDYGIEVPLHCGATYHYWSYDSDGNVFCKKIGCDYQHLNDKRFGNFTTKDDALEVFEDADELIRFMSLYN